MLRDIAEVALWSALAVVMYSYVVYPLLIWTCARLFGDRGRAAPLADADLPEVSLLIAAHNEERWIRQRLENALATTYPKNKLEIIVASDGSTDATATIVREFVDRGVRLLDYRDNRGKASVLNDGVREARGCFVVFSDANTFFDPPAVHRLMDCFADPRVGAACGRLVLTDPATGRNLDSVYWKYETFLKKCESRLGALLGANGAIYAVPRADYVPIAADTIVDDFVIPLFARLRTGKAVVYESGAVAREECPPEIRDEFRRRSRIGAGGFQSIVRLWPLLSPTNGWIAFSFLSHKVLRWLCPFFLIVAFVANLFCLDSPGYAVLLAAQVGFYLISAAGPILPGRNGLSRIFRLPAMFTSMNLALLWGFWRWLSGQQRGVWQRTAR